MRTDISLDTGRLFVRQVVREVFVCQVALLHQTREQGRATRVIASSGAPRASVMATTRVKLGYATIG